MNNNCVKNEIFEGQYIICIFGHFDRLDVLGGWE